MTPDQAAALLNPVDGSDQQALAARRRVTEHGDGIWSIVILAVDR